MANGKLDGASEEVRETLMAQFRRIARLHRKRARDRADKMEADRQAIDDLDRFDHLPEQLRDVHATDKPHRPLPSTYLSQEDIDDHLSRFDNGATRLQSRSGYEQYGPGQIDRTSFVMSTDEVDDLIARTGGDQVLMERELGLRPGDLDPPLVRIDFHSPHDHGVRMPSGNEAGANEHWLPGGTTPGEVSEGVLDVGNATVDVDYTVNPYVPGG
jgi:hypothetical protein